MLGICYGHQLLAHLEGAKVEFVFKDNIKRKGLYEGSNRKVRLYYCHLKKSFVFSHNEAVVDLGEHWQELGYSKELRNEFIKHRKKPFGEFKLTQNLVTHLVKTQD